MRLLDGSSCWKQSRLMTILDQILSIFSFSWQCAGKGVPYQATTLGASIQNTVLSAAKLVSANSIKNLWIPESEKTSKTTFYGPAICQFSKLSLPSKLVLGQIGFSSGPGEFGFQPWDLNLPLSRVQVSDSERSK